MEEQSYKWVITYTKETCIFTVIGYVLVDGKWSQDGAALHWSYLDAILHHIREMESCTSRTCVISQERG